MGRSRRNFIRNLAWAVPAATPGLTAIQDIALRELLTEMNRYNGLPANETDSEFWHLVKQAYTVSPSILNLNNGGVAPQPRVVQEAVERYNRLSNEAPSYYMWRILDQGREPLRQNLAKLAGCSPEEIAINRNSSEALETVIFGLPLQRGDEVVLSNYAYPNMINAWKQRERRDGIVLKWVDLDLPSEDDNYLVDSFASQMTSKTKLVHITHVINWNGQVMPAAAISAKARQVGAEVLVDGAHSFAHLAYHIPDLQCDYFGTSLHKWLSAPFGSGMLYVRKEKISALYPLFAAPESDSDDIRKFEHLGTRSFAIEQAIGQAIEFHNMIGAQRKQDRLYQLKSYWVDRVSELPGIDIQTPYSGAFSGAIAVVGFKDKSLDDLTRFLFRDHKIHTTTIKWEKTNGVRVTPNVYTLESDLDRLVNALKKFAET